MKRYEPIEWFFFCIFLGALTLAGYGVYAGTQAITSDGRVDYQGSASGPGKYVFKGHVPWRSDRVLADAKEIADLDKTGCPVSDVR